MTCATGTARLAGIAAWAFASLATAMLIMAAWTGWQAWHDLEWARSAPHASGRALALAWWGWILGMGAATLGTRRPGPSLLWGTLFLGAATHLVLWQALVERGLVGWDLAAVIGLAGPFLGVSAACTVCLIVLRRIHPDMDLTLPILGVGMFLLSLALMQRLGVEYQGTGRHEVLDHLALRHASWFCLGMAVMIAAYCWATPRRLTRLSRKMYLLPLLGAGLLLATWLLGPEVNGRRLWLFVGPLSIQTVELVKPLMVLFFAFYFADRWPAQQVKGCGDASVSSTLRRILPMVIMSTLPLVALVGQKDFGPAVLLAGFLVMMIHLATGSFVLPLTGLCLAGVVSLGSYLLRAPSVLYSRVEAWLNPFQESEHLTRALWSVAKGGVWGTGLGSGAPHTVPLSYSDFIFTALCEEMGLMGGTALLALWGLFACHAFAAANRTKDRRQQLILQGVAVIMALQAVLVMGGVTDLIPLVGLTLPLFSYGGTSLVINLAMVGMVVRISGDIDHG